MCPTVFCIHIYKPFIRKFLFPGAAAQKPLHTWKQWKLAWLSCWAFIIYWFCTALYNWSLTIRLIYSYEMNTLFLWYFKLDLDCTQTVPAALGVHTIKQHFSFLETSHWFQTHLIILLLLIMSYSLGLCRFELQVNIWELRFLILVLRWSVEVTGVIKIIQLLYTLYTHSNGHLPNCHHLSFLSCFKLESILAIPQGERRVCRCK